MVVSVFDYLEDPEHDEGPRQMLGISFLPTQVEPDYSARTFFELHTAVLDINQTRDGNIEFAQGNSWRGDRFGAYLAEAWKASGEEFEG